MDNRENSSWYASNEPEIKVEDAAENNNSFLKPADKTIKIIGTIACALYAMFILFGGMSFSNVIVISAFILFAVSFYPKNKNLMVIIGSGLYLLGIIYSAGYSLRNIFGSGRFGFSSAVSILAILLQIAAIVLLLLMAISIYTKNYRRADKFYKIWFLPGVIVPASIIMRSIHYGFSLRVILVTVAILFVGYDIFKPEMAAYESEQQIFEAGTVKSKKTVGTDPDAIEKLKRISKLYKANEITEEEYNKLRNEYINRI